MSSQISLHPRPLQPSPSSSSSTPATNPLPTLIQTPTGLALLELQGTLNMRDFDPSSTEQITPIPVGRIDFPDYQPNSLTFDPNDKKWMKRVYMYIGEHQRLHGEVKGLGKAMGVVRRRRVRQKEGVNGEGEEEKEELEVLDIIRYKIVFGTRPEPITRGEQFIGRGSEQT
ncbi:Ctf8-domain-containing protein [Neurospora hispaniola]|uniref:Ctf8-domain-containing protein n=1 Tax=Neurospora hispaniola TaxID=588809 RepID=A0AAJ0MQD6_9PEZI|nr:Ctf8-domain-containing protein [Neurospora hispaniola]